MQRQLERKQHSLKPRWRLSIGEWLILLLNLTLTGMSAWILLAILADNLRGRRDHGWEDYLTVGGTILTLGGSSLTSLILLLRKPRIAARLQWFAATGAGLILAVILGARLKQPLHPLLLHFAPIATCLLLTLLLIASGRFLRTVDNET